MTATRPRVRQVPARRGPSGRWCIPWDPATREIYRQVAGSFRLNPVLPKQPVPFNAATADI